MPHTNQHTKLVNQLLDMLRKRAWAVLLEQCEE